MNTPIAAIGPGTPMPSVATTTTVATTAVAAREGIVRKTQFPRLVIPMSVVLTSMFNLGMNMIAVLVFALALGVYPVWTWLLMPVTILLQ